MFDYYYGNEAEQFSFLRVPKFLFTDKEFTDLSNDGKILYSLMLDRMSLSIKNGWLDEKNRVYIIFTQDEARQCMNCGNDKCVKIFEELENIGLISRKNRGMGHPALIYVKNFVSISEEISEEEIKEKSEEVKTSEKIIRKCDLCLITITAMRRSSFLFCVYRNSCLRTRRLPICPMRENPVQFYA